jgi:hypothetical protein
VRELAIDPTRENEFLLLLVYEKRPLSGDTLEHSIVDELCEDGANRIPSYTEALAQFLLRGQASLTLARQLADELLYACGNALMLCRRFAGCSQNLRSVNLEQIKQILLQKGTFATNMF